MANKKYTNDYIAKELEKLRKEVAALKMDNEREIDVIIDDVEETYTFTQDELFQFANEIKTKTVKFMCGAMRTVSFDDCAVIDLDGPLNTINISVDTDQISDRIEDEFTTDDWTGEDMESILGIYEQICIQRDCFE